MENEFSRLVNALPGLVWSAHPDGSADFFNQHYLDYVGLSSEQAHGSGWTVAVHPNDLKGLIAAWQSVMASGKPAESEARLRRFDGEYRWFLFRTNPLHDESGNIAKWLGINTDIEDRKKAEEALRANERDLSQMINAIPTFIQMSRPDGTVLSVNQAVLDYHGVSLQDVQKEDFRDRFYHPDDVKSLREERKDALKRPLQFEYEQRALGKDGRYRWFLVRYNPLLDEQGRIERWYAAAVDITERKQMEEALRASELKVRRVIDTIPALAWCNLPDGPNEFLNKGWHEYTGLSEEQSHGWGWQAAFHPEDLPLLMEKWRKMLSSGESDAIEARLRRHDGVYRWFLIRAEPFLDESGKIVRWYGTSTDIDDRKRAEAQVEQAYLRLAEAQRLSKTGSFISDLVADDHNWSDETFRIFEFDPATKVTVQMVRDIMHPEDLPTFDAVIARGMTGADVDFAFRIVPRRGTVKHVRAMARLMTQDGGRLLFIGAVQDVTESKVVEEALNRARSELAHVARVSTLNALTASIAHEINQPLSGIITNASTCLRMLDGDPPNITGARETARRTLRDGNRASDVISRLRALYRNKEFTLEQVDLNEAAREVIALCLSDLQRNRVILKSEFADDLPHVTGDRVQLQQVILNLLRNASDAMRTVQNRPRELLIITQREDKDQVRVTLKDVGVGFTPKAGAKLFEAFYTTKKDGMGIGLSVSRSIIERHHGRLWAEPNDGPGATFSFSIPCSLQTVARSAP